MRNYQNILNRLTLIDQLSTIFCDFIASLIICHAFNQTIAKNLAAEKSLILNLLLLLTINIAPILIKNIIYSTPIKWDTTKWNSNVFNVYCNINDPHCTELVKQAVKSWNKCRHIHIQMTDDINKAQIRIYKCFIQNANWTANTVNDNYKLSLPITLNYYYLNKLDNATIRATIEHELGHAMGLGHSAGKKSVMYPFTQKQEITILDRYNLDKLY